ncbi:hypothetical protein BD309DRAFT_859388 [Dichomitus squalens]|uniref:Fungal-type protein kinase domain-containing protein n=1 Tax=Dichomitus squalens TaxID=114155 RepID=A0A4Q9PQF0_9APHY|nr:hypothetical protein BD311DRAFT_697383 [Dichomitus squalens]TBU45833.1 hypothetical protein BD309DRAFT_859388 [Dichomitus squalens]TBU56583.1 hypothetical protein BD310DRAFT_931218 [Dichomitus squalens]
MATQSCVYDVPMALDSTLSRTRGLDPSSAMERNNQHLSDCLDHLLGPMPTDDFLDTFLPLSSQENKSGKARSRNAFKDVPVSWDAFDEMCSRLLPALNKRTPKQARCPGFVFEVAATRSLHPSEPGFMKPGICCYASDNVAAVHNSPFESRVELGYAELFIDMQPDPMDDSFIDPPSNNNDKMRDSHEFLRLVEDDPINAIRTLGQHVAFVTEILARQFRTFLFSISLSGSSARLLRWDRSGCVVTEAFDIRQDPETLCEFLWRFSQTSNAGRGHDTSVQLAPPDEQSLFLDALRIEVRAQLELDGPAIEEAVREHYSPGHVYTIDISRQDLPASMDTTRRYLVSRPVISPLTLVGRGTRGYWAVDVVTRSVAFLKDTWRLTAVEELEAHTLQRLNDLGVRHVPLLAWHGDVYESTDSSERPTARDYQRTSTDRVRSASWLCQVNQRKLHISRRRHYRVVLGTVGYGISRLRGAEELLHAGYDVYVAMRDAFDKDSRVHRDLSVGNIILVKHPDHPVRKGYLIDWEVSCKVDDAGEAREVGRVGTWRFLSRRMLHPDGDELKHTFQDDMEALFYVVLWCALMYQPHNLTLEELRKIVAEVFDERVPFMPGIVRGGGGKMANAMFRSYTSVMEFGSKHLDEWIKTVADFISSGDEWKGEDEDKWSNPEHLDVYWATFLQTHTLERDNRFVHVLRAPRKDGLPPLASKPPSHHLHSGHTPPSYTSARPKQESRKRASSEPNADAEPRTTKRLRSGRAHVQQTADRLFKYTRSPSEGRRRSERLVKKREEEVRVAEEKRQKDRAGEKATARGKSRGGARVVAAGTASKTTRTRTTSETGKGSSRKPRVRRRAASHGA